MVKHKSDKHDEGTSISRMEEMFMNVMIAQQAGGSKIHASGREVGWYLISGLGHKISCQTRNTIESLLKVKVARTRT